MVSNSLDAFSNSFLDVRRLDLGRGVATGDEEIVLKGEGRGEVEA